MEEGEQVLTDWFSFSVLFPVRAAGSKSFCAIVEDRILLVYEVPELLVTGNGSQFVAKPFQELFRKYDERPFRNAVYHPQSNSAERVNKVVRLCWRGFSFNADRNYLLPSCMVSEKTFKFLFIFIVSFSKTLY
jgi:transposase InsO family protein